MLPDSLFLLAKGGRVILSRNRDVSGGHAIGTQCDLWAIASKFGRHNSRRRAPTRGASTNCQSFSDKKPASSSRERPLEFATAHYDCLLSAFGPGKGTHKGCPYRLSSVGVWPWEGHPQGAPLPIVFSRRLALGRAPYRLSSVGVWRTHKGCPYRLSSVGVLPWEGHPQGVPLPIVFCRRLALGRAPTRGAPTDCLLSAFGPGKGTHKGCPYRLSSVGVWPWEGHPQGVPLPIVFCRRLALGRAPTRGAPTDCLLSAFGPGKGTHKGCPYRLSSVGVLPWEGRPQGVPLPIVFCRRLALGRAPTRGAPTDCLLSAFCPGKGAHKGCPYRLSSVGVLPWEGHPQGVPLPIVFCRRLALGRAPTRGAPTDCLLSAFGPGKGTPAPTDCLLSAFGPGTGTHKGRPYRLFSLGVWPWEGHPQGVPLPIVFCRCLALGRAPTRGAPTDCLLSAFCPEKGAHKGRPYPIQAVSRGFF